MVFMALALLLLAFVGPKAGEDIVGVPLAEEVELTPEDNGAMPCPVPASRPVVLYNWMPILHTSLEGTCLPLRSISPAG